MKSCPFCGSRDVYVLESDNGISRCVSCNQCECDGPCIQYTSKLSKEQSREWVIQAWNERAGDDFDDQLYEDCLFDDNLFPATHHSSPGQQ